MDRSEMESLKKQLTAAGLTEEEIMDTFYETFEEGKMGKDDLKACAEFMGYELTPEFEADDHAAPAEGGEGTPDGGITKEQAEQAKENPPAPAGEAKDSVPAPENGEKNDNPAPANEAKDGNPAPAPAPKDEDAEWKEAQQRLHW